MLNSLLGIVSEKFEDSIALDTGAIEWLILMPTKDMEKLKLNEEVRIYTYLQHHENLMQLFGFIKPQGRLLFLDLLKVNGIGPKQAVKILSNVEAPEFVEILNAGDTNKLIRIPGIGKITAQKILLTLQGKLTTEKDFSQTSTDFEYADILTALTEMGFDRRRAKECIVKIVSEKKSVSEEINENELLRAAIIALSSG
ncbi:MAG: Holliday junction branch migration protein RuvA [Treponemataceae bacterium]